MGWFNFKIKGQSIKGQSLIEVIIGIIVGAMLIASAAAAVTLVLKNNLEARATQIAASLAVEYLDGVSSIAESNWSKVYFLSGKGPSSQFYLETQTGNYVIQSGATSTAIDNRIFTRYFSIENVNRENCGVGNITSAGQTGSCPAGFSGSSGSDVYEDSSTQKITATVEWPTSRKISLVRYLTRSQNLIFRQTDWSGGWDQEIFPSGGTLINNQFATSTNIDYSTSTGAIVVQGF